MAHKTLQLPSVVIGPADLTRVKRQLEAFNEQQHQADLRSKMQATANPMRLGKLYADIAALNGYDLRNADHRHQLLSDIETALKSAPTVTMSFAVDPSAEFMVKIVEWFRRSVHPQLLIRVGLQPTLAAGCTLRTPSKQYDFSLRRHFTEQRPLLVRRLREVVHPVKQVALQAPAVEVPASEAV